MGPEPKWIAIGVPADKTSRGWDRGPALRTKVTESGYVDWSSPRPHTRGSGPRGGSGHRESAPKPRGGPTIGKTLSWGRVPAAPRTPENKHNAMTQVRKISNANPF
ncbi:hypothetical protein NDU88_003151 [Pleurodeles waltl]|uniref:Uncharacterized protein n=1 Tax=Pleurodeles waltl TaxID=8319 RepID=A0AAV7TNW2_PLEWA|nr:hypothetical protein NDU88_003151 [Pleurodeles waltl]